jgi:O-antigen/teichoic acid export membrane protein
MSLTDKVIKNTYFFFISQLIGFILPLFLTPFLVSKIGQIQFGIYALVLGFTGTFGLFDLSLSSSFIKFISEHYNKGEKEELNKTINTGLFFYIFTSVIVCSVGFIFADKFISLFNISPELVNMSVTALRISVIVFFISSSFGIFNSILASLQKMYLTSIVSIITNLLMFIVTILVVMKGYGLIGIMVVILFVTIVNNIISFIYAKRELPYVKISIRSFSKLSLKKMLKIGTQMQVSKLASFASEKYDEFLLGAFSVMNNVTFFNMANRVARFGRLFPMQLYQQGAPVAAELNAKNEKEKLVILLGDATKYISLITAPIFIYIFIFSDLIINSWLGPGFEISINILRILAIGQFINMIFSAPGNSIIPNIGVPKYQMYEGLIGLFLNIPLSFFLIKYYGIIGAAYGNTISVVVSSFYLFFTSIKFFELHSFKFFGKYILKPMLIALVSSAFLYLFYYISNVNVYHVIGRVGSIIYLASTGLLFVFIYYVAVLKSNYLNERDRVVIAKIFYKFIPIKYFNLEFKDNK